MIDLGTGNNNKINWPIEDKQEVRRLGLNQLLSWEAERHAC